MLPCKAQELAEVFENVVDCLLRQHLGDQNTKYLLKKKNGALLQSSSNRSCSSGF